MEFSSSRIIKLADAQNAIPTSDGKLYAEMFRHGTLTVEIYAPKGMDLQQPHTRDEVYIVAAGRGWFFVRARACSSVRVTRSLPPPARSTVLRISLKTCWSGWSFTVLKAASVARRAVVALLLAFPVLLLPAQAHPESPAAEGLDEAAASRLLLQLSEALEGHSQSQFLALFELAKMKNGPSFGSRSARSFPIQKLSACT